MRWSFVGCLALLLVAVACPSASWADDLSDAYNQARGLIGSVPNPGPPRCAYCGVVNPTMAYHHRSTCPYYSSGVSSGGSSGSSASHAAPYVRPHKFSSENQAKLAMAQTMVDTFGAMLSNMLFDDSGAKAAAAARARAEEEARIRALIDRQVAEEAAARAAGKKEWAACLARHEQERAALQASWAQRLADLAASLKVPDFDGRGAGLGVKIAGTGGTVDPMGLKLGDPTKPALGVKVGTLVDPRDLKQHDPARPSLAIKPPPPPPAFEPGEALPPALQPLKDGYDYVQGKVAGGLEAVDTAAAKVGSLIGDRGREDGEALVHSAAAIPGTPGADDRSLYTRFVDRGVLRPVNRVLEGARDNVGNESAASAIANAGDEDTRAELDVLEQGTRKSLKDKVKEAFKPAP